MQRRAVAQACALFLGTGVLGCRDEAVVIEGAPSTPLLEGFSSRQKIADVEGSLRREGRSITVVEAGADLSAQQKSDRPFLSVRILRVTPFKLWEVDGELRLEFVNGELASTWFYPANPRDLEVAMTRRSLTVGPNGTLRPHAGTELRAGVDFTGAKYWAWEDVHLRQEVERWIKQNA